MPYADLTQRFPSRSASWAGAAFVDELSDWVRSEVGVVVSVEPVKVRPWAAVWRVRAGAGTFFAKQNCALQQYEPGVLRVLADVAPDLVVPVTAVDEERGLLLTPDQGPVFEETAGDDVEPWVRLVVAAARLQRAAAEHVASLESAGLTVLSPRDAPGYTRRRLDELTQLPEESPYALTAGQSRSLRAALPAVEKWGQVVAALGLPLTVNHNDLHGNNAFEVDGRSRFFDFADAVLGDPLGALLIPLNVLATSLSAGPEDPRLVRVADAALETWSDLASLRDLRRALPAALQLARLARVESWVRCCASMTDGELAEWGPSVPGWLGTLAEASPPVGRLDGLV